MGGMAGVIVGGRLDQIAACGRWGDGGRAGVPFWWRW